MSKDREHERPSSPWLSYNQYNQHIGATQNSLAVSTELNNQGRPTFSAARSSVSGLPTRSLTVSTSDPSRTHFPSTSNQFLSQTRSEDYNHLPSSSGSNYSTSNALFSAPRRPSPPFYPSATAVSRPNTPGTSTQSKNPSSSSHSDPYNHSNPTPHPETSSSNSKPLPASTSVTAGITSTYVSINFAFFRYLGSHFHSL